MLEFKSQSMDASTALTSRTLLELQRDSLFNRNYNSVFLNSYNFTYIGMNMRPDGVKHKKYSTMCVCVAPLHYWFLSTG